MVAGGLSRFTISVPNALCNEFESAAKEMGQNRSKAVSLAMRNFLAEYAWDRKKDRKGAGALTLVYDHEKPNVDRQLTETQHRYHEVIVSATHIHLDERNCLLIVAVSGKIESIQSLAREMMETAGVKQLRITTLAP